MGTPNREPQEYSRNIIEIHLPGSLYSIIFLPYSLGSLFGVPTAVTFKTGARVERLGRSVAWRRREAACEKAGGRTSGRLAQSHRARKATYARAFCILEVL